MAVARGHPVAVEIRMESSSPFMAEPRKGSKALAGRVSRSATGKQRFESDVVCFCRTPFQKQRQYDEVGLRGGCIGHLFSMMAHGISIATLWFCSSSGS